MADQEITPLQPGEKAPVIVAPMHVAPRTPQQAAEGHKTTTMEFPSAVHLTTAPNSSVFYPAGVHEVPNHLVGHWYLKAHGARVYNRGISVPAGVEQTGAQQRRQQRQQQRNPNK